MSWKTEMALSEIPFIRALILFMRTPPLWPNRLPKAAPPLITTLGIRISTCEFRGEKHLVYSIHAQDTDNFVSSTQPVGSSSHSWWGRQDSVLLHSLKVWCRSHYTNSNTFGSKYIVLQMYCKRNDNQNKSPIISPKLNFHNLERENLSL